MTQLTHVDYARIINKNIEAARAAMDDPPLGYVLHTEDFTLFLYTSPTASFLGWPPKADAVLSSLPSARVLQRHWAAQSSVPLSISLRGEALSEYIRGQQELLDLLTSPAKGNAE